MIHPKKMLPGMGREPWASTSALDHSAIKHLDVNNDFEHLYDTAIVKFTNYDPSKMNIADDEI